MGALAVIGLVIIMVGVLGLFGVLHIGLVVAIVLCVAGLLAVVLSRDSLRKP